MTVLVCALFFCSGVLLATGAGILVTRRRDRPRYQRRAFETSRWHPETLHRRRPQTVGALTSELILQTEPEVSQQELSAGAGRHGSSTDLFGPPHSKPHDR